MLDLFFLSDAQPYPLLWAQHDPWLVALSVGMAVLASVLALQMAGLARRDTMVFDFALTQGLPIAVAMAGGYGRQIENTVAVHTQTVMLAAQYHARYGARRGSPSAGAAVASA